MKKHYMSPELEILHLYGTNITTSSLEEDETDIVSGLSIDDPENAAAARANGYIR